jgi:segregation and condensation protein B
MPPLHLRSAVEALLFSSDQPLTLVMLADALDAPTEELTEVLRALGDEYVARSAGVELREMAGGWIVTTTAEQHEWVARMLRGKRRMRLSRAALETLAIIAYKQPVTKSEIEAIRGVDSSGTLATLLERALVTIKGRSTVVGRPLLYGSTPDFLNYFGLRDLAELPRPEELRALVAAREPEQLEMLELDGDGMPLALAAKAEAFAAGAAAAAGDAGAAADDGTDATAAQVAGDARAASDGAEVDEDEEEFEDDDEEDEYDEEDEEDEDDEDEEDGDEAGERPSATLTERNGR